MTAGERDPADATLGGYLRVHSRPPAFAGPDGRAYSVGVYVDGEPDSEGRFGAALLFVCWSDTGDRPVGHVETDHLCYGATPDEAGARLRELTLHDVKRHLDQVVSRRKTVPDW